jgi:hypothetical protein
VATIDFNNIEKYRENNRVEAKSAWWASEEHMGNVFCISLWAGCMFLCHSKNKGPDA